MKNKISNGFCRRFGRHSCCRRVARLGAEIVTIHLPPETGTYKKMLRALP